MLSHGDLVSLLVHAFYLTWATKVVAAATQQWQRFPYGDSLGLMTVEGLHHWLFLWGVREGRIKEDKPTKKYSLYAAELYDEDRDAVIAEARNYWRVKYQERTAR